MPPPKPQKIEAVPEPLPEVLTCAIGETEEGRACVVWLTTQGERVTRTQRAFTAAFREVAEAEWREQVYLHLFLNRGKVPPPSAPAAKPLQHAHGLTLHKVRSTWTLLEVETDGATVTRSEVVAKDTDWIVMWERFSVEADRRLLDSRRKRKVV